MISTSRFPSLLQSASIAIATLDRHGHVLDVNRALTETLDRPSGELTGLPFDQLFGSADRSATESALAELASGARDEYRSERRIVTSAGRPLDVEVRVSPVRDAAPVAFVAVMQDVTPRAAAPAEASGRIAALEAALARTEQALQQSEERYRMLVAQTPLSMQILSATGTTLRVNAAWERLWGLTLDQLKDYNLLDDPQLVDRGLMPHLLRAFAGEVSEIPAALYDPDRTLPDESRHDDARRWVRAVIYPLKDAEGRVCEVVLIHEDITERVRAEEARADATGLLQLLVQHSGEAIVVSDARGVIRVFNPAAERLYGVPAAPTPPEAWADWYHLYKLDGTPLPYEETALFRAVRGQAVREARWLVKRPDGTMRTLVGNSLPLRRQDGESAGAVLIARDDTNRLAAEEERERLLVQTQRAHREVETASRLKDEFLATLSHELRTPLNAILGWARILRSRDLDAQTSRALDVIDRNAAAQARLIDDLLDMSRIITGKIRLQVEPVDLTVIAANALETVKPAADAKGVAIATTFAPSLPLISGDPQRLQQVLWNLLSNAVKFTEAGGRVTVEITRRERSVAIVVSDTGIGISPAMLPSVFDRFTQGDSSSTRRHSGLGLGLAIVKHLVELHGGSAVAESPGDGQGATIRVWLPVAIGIADS